METDLERRQRLLAALAGATDDLGRALAALGGAHELLDDQQADSLDERLHGPVRRAYGRASRTHAEFAARHNLPGRRFELPSAGAPSTGVKGFVEHAAAAAEQAEADLVALQDSLLPVQVGDPELRAGLSEVRRLIDGFSRNSRAFVSTFGR